MSDERVRQVLDAVAALDSYPQGDDDWPTCPFGCAADLGFPPNDSEPYEHAPGCPITLARELHAQGP